MEHIKHQLKAWLVFILGILIILPMFGVDIGMQVSSGALGWLIPALILIIGFLELVHCYKK